MEKIGYVYLTTNLVNGKQYVGQHLHDDFDVKYKGSGHYIKKAFDKYGWNNFDCKVICWCSTQTQLNEAEDNYIKLLNTMVPNGYNLKGGGSHGKYSYESRKKISETTKKNMLNPNIIKKLSEAKMGRKLSEDTCKKISTIVKNRWKSIEYKDKISKSLKGKPSGMKGKHQKEETRAKLSKALTNNPKKSRKVFQCTKDGEFVKEWTSLHEIERQLGYNIGHISYCCHGKLKSAYGFLWSFTPIN